MVTAVVCMLEPFLEESTQKENRFGRIVITEYRKNFNAISKE
jgi:hypothetical protein